MKTFRIFTVVSLLFLSAQAIRAQNAPSIVTAVKQRQAALKSLSYTLQRTDTLVTGDIRTMSGQAVISVGPEENAIGFRFRARRNGFAQETVFDGRLGYVADTVTRSYKVVFNPDENIFYSTTGGQMIVPEVIRLDTAGATSITASEDSQHYYLTFTYPDLTEHDVSKRYKVVGIDKQTMLPVYVRKHQETLGKVQDLQFRVSDLQLSEKSLYDFSEPDFIRHYQQETAPLKAENPLSQLLGKSAPDVSLPSFESDKLSPLTAPGKVVLLDFWEAWCGPCIASMPKVQQLYDRYHKHGLEVYGITHEINQLDISKKRIAKAGLTFPMLIGNEASRKSFHVSAIPLYALIGKDGTIRYLHEGFSDALEREIQKALAR